MQKLFYLLGCLLLLFTLISCTPNDEEVSANSDSIGNGSTISQENPLISQAK